MSLQLVLFGMIGLLLGSFGNMLLYRIKVRKSFGGRSFCPSCKHTIAAYDLIPVLSYVFLGGKCRHCRKSISIGYPLVELASMGVFLVAIVAMHGDSIGGALVGIALWSTLLLSVYDTKHQQIPDLFTIIIAAAALGLIALGYSDWFDSLLGMIVAAAWFAILILVSRGKAVGSGDLFLSGALGLLVGLIGAITMLLTSYIIGALVILFMLATRKLKKLHHQRIAFGPFLVMGAIFALFGFGEWYLSLLGL